MKARKRVHPIDVLVNNATRTCATSRLLHAVGVLYYCCIIHMTGCLAVMPPGGTRAWIHAASVVYTIGSCIALMSSEHLIDGATEQTLKGRNAFLTG